MKVGQEFLEVVMIDILENLPVRSLVRFRSVSKLWCNLIKTSYFIKRHLAKRRVNDHVVMVRRFIETPIDNIVPSSRDPDVEIELSQRDDVFSFHDIRSVELNEARPSLVIPFLNDIEYGYDRLYSTNNVHLFGPIDGIICIVCDGCVIFSNPALREFKQLPPCHYTSPKGYYHYFEAQGFGNTSSNDFKVVLVRSVDPNGDPDIDPALIDGWRKAIHLYNSATNSWKKIYDDKGFPCIEHSPCSDTFFKGSFHWNAATLKRGIGLDIVLSLNLDTETFIEFEYPEYFKGLLESQPCLMVLNECLSMLWFKEGSTTPIEVWVMKEYGVRESWTKQFVIGPYKVVRVFCYWKNDEWLLTENIEGQLESCGVHTKAIKSFQIYGSLKTVCALIYKDSLVSLNSIIGKSSES